MHRISLLIIGLAVSVMGLSAGNSLNGSKAEGYRGIWFELGQVNNEYGDKYSGGLGTYTVKHIPMAIYSPEADKTFFVYGGTTAPGRKYLVCMAGCYDHKTGMLQRPVTVHDKGVDGVLDPHDNPTIQMDKDGHLWIFVAGRGNTRPGIIYRSSKPYDISSFEYVSEDIMAYPQVFYDPEKGFFQFFTRYDGKRRTFFRTSKDGYVWSEYRPIASIMEPGEKMSGHYQITGYDGKKLMCSFNRHPGGDCDRRTNIYYIQSEDWGMTWTNAAGEKVELPITREDGPALVKNFRKDGRNCYIKDVNVDAEGNPMILYVTSDNHLTGPDGGEREWEVARWNGKEWEHTFITNSTHCYDSGALYVDGEEWNVVGPTQPGPQYWGTGGEMAIWQTVNNGVIWERVSDLTRNSVRNHSYARRPQNAHPDFYAFWADGDADRQSISYLYFCNKSGEVFRMPYTMKEEWQRPEKVVVKPVFDARKAVRSKHPRILMDAGEMADYRKKVLGRGEGWQHLKQMDKVIEDKVAALLKENKGVEDATKHRNNVERLLYFAYSYRVHDNKAVLPQLKKDLAAICSDHWGEGFLGIAEQALAVAVAYDWIWGELSDAERESVCKALIDKVIRPSAYSNFHGFKGNWSSICNSGIVAACLAVYEYAPELAAEFIESSYWNNKENIGIVYGGGGYPEGFSYWNYGTMYQICMNEALKSIYGHDGGLSDTPGFMESADFALYAHATANTVFSFADGGSNEDHPLIASWWFASERKDASLVYPEKRFLDEGAYDRQRMLPLMACLSRGYDLSKDGFDPPAEQMWSCQGEIPLCIVRRGWNYDKSDVYLGVKGGDCHSWKSMVTSHSHMDAGSFVFEAEGVRWSDDIMRPSYGKWFKALKDAGSHSGATYQEGLRWSTFRVSNMGHSCLVSYCNDGSVENKLHPTDYYVEGAASLAPVDEDGRQGAVVDMSAPMKGQVKSATRTVVVLEDGTLEVTDVVEALPDMDCPLEWRMFSKTDAKVSDGGIMLSRNGLSRELTAKASDNEIKLEYEVQAPGIPQSWEGEFTYYQVMFQRSIALWRATVPAGQKVTFVTTLRKAEVPIDRKSLVTRNNPEVHGFDELSSLSVGNGEFAVTVDFTGLQTYPEAYSKGIPLGTQAQWGWHSFPNPEGFRYEETLVEYDFGHGHKETYSVSDASQSDRSKAAVSWFRTNPHRLHLGTVGFNFSRPVNSSDFTAMNQKLDMWNGIIRSKFSLDGKRYDVKTVCHPEKDMMAASVSADEPFEMVLRYPYPSGGFNDDACDWTRPELHSSTVVEQGEGYAVIERVLDDSRYYVKVQWEGKASLHEKEPHVFVLKSVGTDLSFSCLYTLEKPDIALPGFRESARAASAYWKRYWTKGAVVDFAECTDPRAAELERRVVLSQYLLAIQCSGSTPPQETGLTYNSWFGKYHLEMIFWHQSWFAQWGRPEMLAKTLKWYHKAYPVAREYARRQGFKGVRWMKMTDPSGMDSPSSIGTFLIWQQPHIIYMAELLYRYGKSASLLEEYGEMIDQTAVFMADFATYDSDNDRYILKGLIPAQETMKPQNTFNPPFELVYWKWGLECAQTWRERRGLKRVAEWDEIISKMSPLAQKDGLYLAAESEPDTYSNEKLFSDHMSVLGAFGVLPDVGLMDRSVMDDTFEWVWKNWNWGHTWGWDFPMTAMNAVRLGRPEEAVQALLKEQHTNTYLVNGHNYQNKLLRLYLPGNGATLLAVGLMCAGWDGCEVRNPGFPDDGKWNVRWEGLSPLP